MMKVNKLKKSIYSVLFFTTFVGINIYGQGTTNLGVDSGTDGRFGVYIGEKAGQSSISPQASYNTFVGFNSGLNNITGFSNTFLGSLAGEDFDVGSHNIFIGNSAGRYATGGFRNILIGTATAIYLTGSSNTILGNSGGRSLTTGNSNTYVGYDTGYSNSTGSNNTALGRKASQHNKSGSRNVSVGEDAGYSNLNGSNNVVLGYKAGYLNTGGSNVFLGFGAGYNELGSNKLYIENSYADIPLIYGDFSSNIVGINTKEIPAGYAFAVNGKAIAEEIKVQLHSAWPDYVFKSEYDLLKLSDLESYIDKNGHLPEVPNSVAVSGAGGVELGQMNVILLKKIEELTLYLLEEHSLNKALLKRIEALEKESK